MDEYYRNSNEEKFILKDGPRSIRSQRREPDIQSLYNDYKTGDLNITPIFQRKFVWGKDKSSSLVESIMLNIPLPIIFTASKGEQEEVIDGQQRLTSIFSFMDGKFPDGSEFRLPKKLKILGDELGGKTFSELSKNFQKTFKKYPLTVVCIAEESQEDVKFEMFERLNTKITRLNAQELRNCLYRGGYNEFLRMMANDDDFQYILNAPTKKKRMLDVELVLMFCAFYNTSPEHYRTSLPQMLNHDMRNNKSFTDGKREELEEQFKKSVQLIKHIWDKNAFNFPNIDETTVSIFWSKQFNQGLFQILMYWFFPYKINQILPYADLIREELINLQIHDNPFRDSLTGSGTDSPKKVRIKFDIWGVTLKGILGYPNKEPRAFSFALKEQLWNSEKICGICSQRIRSIDDAEVDHIICYWKGGKTIPENARLTHRLCNRLRGGDIRKDSSYSHRRPR